MSEYPQLQDYNKNKNYQDGIRRCDELLEKSPDDVELLTTKFELLLADKQDGQSTLDKLVAFPRVELKCVFQVEEAILATQLDVYPRPLSIGPSANKLWDRCAKGMKSAVGKHDTAGIRFARALCDNRLVDVQQALIQLKSLFPKNRAMYFAHAAFTQLISTSNDDLQSRLALSLARKAVKENFDEDKNLDCRVPGQIFAIQGCKEDLEKMKDRSFAKSKQVSDAFRKSDSTTNGTSHEIPDLDPASVSTLDWLDAEVKKLNATFTRCIHSNADPSVMTAFAGNAVRLFHTGMTSLLGVRQRLITDSCFLAISALVRLFEQSSHSVYLLQAAYLSERLLQHNPHIHEAKLVLIYLFMRLGLGTLAIKQFESLNIREVQLDTVGHVLFGRLGSVYPWGTSLTKRDTFDPLKRTTTALNVYARYESKMTETLEDIIHHGQTGMIFDIQELRHNMQTSYTRRQTLLEHRRIARMTDGVRSDLAKPEALGPRATANWTTITDNRDFDECFNFGYNVEKVLHTPVPDTTTLLYGLVADTLWSIAHDQGHLVKDTAVLLRTFKDSLHEKSAGLTSAEQVSAMTFLHTLSIYQESSDIALATSSSAQLQQSIAALQKALPDGRDELATTLHDHYVYLDTLKVISAFVKKIAKQIPAQAEISSIIAASVDALHKSAKSKKNSISPTSIKDMMTKEIGAEIWKNGLNAFNGPDLINFCDDACKSAREGWDGVLKMKS